MLRRSDEIFSCFVFGEHYFNVMVDFVHIFNNKRISLPRLKLLLDCHLNLFISEILSSCLGNCHDILNQLTKPMVFLVPELIFSRLNSYYSSRSLHNISPDLKGCLYSENSPGRPPS